MATREGPIDLVFQTMVAAFAVGFLLFCLLGATK